MKKKHKIDKKERTKRDILNYNKNKNKWKN